ncbi:hypothetical protein [Hwanghaeella sp.]|uniref:hypothetical protein n=1 Tax=Hwanghaeella sp. TaxID=2605943 RepID=UPI003CCB8C8E
MSIKTFLLAIAMTAMTFLPAQADSHMGKKGPTDVVTVVTASDPQVQLMAMVLTMQSAKRGLAPSILLCGPAGDMALADAPASATTGQPPMNMSPKGLMLKIMEMPMAKVDVCALYLPGKGLDASALTKGIGVAKPPAMAEALMAPHSKVLSF